MVGGGVLRGAGGMFKTLLLASLTVWAAVLVLPDDRLHVVVCDVGQGDAILVSSGANQMLVDGGPDDKVLTCLARHMPFFDKRIEVVILTHPQADHMSGLINVVRRYSIVRFVKGEQSNNTQGYEELMQEIRNKKLEIRSLYTGDEIQIQNLKFKIIWPERGFESKELNDTAIVGRLSFGGFDALLTGDADSRVELAEMATGLIVPVEVLKVPHHGSKTGMLASWLKQVKPKLAVISVGKTNGYGHPSSEAIKLLQEVGSKMMRTDRDGEVEVVSDGKRWWVSSRSTN